MQDPITTPCSTAVGFNDSYRIMSKKPKACHSQLHCNLHSDLNSNHLQNIFLFDAQRLHNTWALCASSHLCPPWGLGNLKSRQLFQGTLSPSLVLRIGTFLDLSASYKLCTFFILQTIFTLHKSHLRLHHVRRPSHPRHVHKH